MFTKKASIFVLFFFLILSAGFANDFDEDDIAVHLDNSSNEPADNADEGIITQLEVNSPDNSTQNNNALLTFGLPQKYHKQIKLLTLDGETVQALQSSEAFYYSSTEPIEQISLGDLIYCKGQEDAIANMPVLDQNTTNTCITFSSTAALDILCNGGQDAYSIYKSLEVGHGLYKNQKLCPDSMVQMMTEINGAEYGYPNPWTSNICHPLILSQFTNFGLYPQRDQDDQNGNFGNTENKTTSIVSPEGFSIPPFIYEPLYFIQVKPLMATGVDKKDLVDTIKNELNTGHLVLVCIPLYNFGNDGMTAKFYPQSNKDYNLYTYDYNYFKNKSNSTYNVWFYRKGMEKEKPSGGHGLLITGYCDSVDGSNKGVFIVRNSWGKANGDNGDNYIDYNYTTNLTITAVSVYYQSGD